MSDQANTVSALPPGAEDVMTPATAASTIHSHAHSIMLASYSKETGKFLFSPEEAAHIATALFTVCFDHGAILHRSGVYAAKEGLRDIYAELCAEYEKGGAAQFGFGNAPP